MSDTMFEVVDLDPNFTPPNHEYALDRVPEFFHGPLVEAHDFAWHYFHKLYPHISNDAIANNMGLYTVMTHHNDDNSFSGLSIGQTYPSGLEVKGAVISLLSDDTSTAGLRTLRTAQMNTELLEWMQTQSMIHGDGHRWVAQFGYFFVAAVLRKVGDVEMHCFISKTPLGPHDGMSFFAVFTIPELQAIYCLQIPNDSYLHEMGGAFASILKH